MDYLFLMFQCPYLCCLLHLSFAYYRCWMNLKQILPLYTVFLPNIFCQKVRFLPPFQEIPSKKGILISQNRIPLAISILPKENSLFRGEFPIKGVKASLSDKKKNLAEIPCITVEFVSDSFSTYIFWLSSLFFFHFWFLWN